MLEFLRFLFFIIALVWLWMVVSTVFGKDPVRQKLRMVGFLFVCALAFILSIVILAAVPLLFFRLKELLFG